MNIPKRGKPLKRHLSLQPLSREHHQGLLLAQYLRADVPDYKGYPTDLEGRLKLAQQHFEGRWRPHFEKEENLLIPAVQGVNAEIDDLCELIIKEHREMLALLEAAARVSAAPARDKLHRLGRLFVDHIRREERVWYMKIQKQVSEEVLDGLLL